MSGAFELLNSKMEKGGAVIDRPKRGSFEEFLLNDAKVPVGGGNYGPYSFKGREAILHVVRVIDYIIGSRKVDALLSLAGGAQFGKTILELNLAAYATSQPFLNFGLFLPDVNLVSGVIDTKFRPDVVDQIGWFADMVKVGKAENKSGKSVDRKGAFMVTDGISRSTGMAIGLQKVPTTFTFDIAAMDEVDDIPEKNAKFVRGRLTSSDLRFILKIGTQRIHGRGQEKAWKDGSQGVFVFDGINPEEAFPGVIRCAVNGSPRLDDPKLTWVGDFKRDGSEEIVAVHKPANVYYLAHPGTGVPMNRFAPDCVHRRPERMEDNNWSFRISQLSIGAIGLSQIVSQFQLAVADPDEMTVFRCDVLALPQSTAQAITPGIIQRAQTVEPFEMRMKPANGLPVYGGIDTGDRCYFLGNERESAARRRAIYAATFSAGDLVARGVSLFNTIGLSCLFIDQRPLVSQSRTLALILNGLAEIADFPKVPEANGVVRFPNGLVWDGRIEKWIGLKCAVVRFDKKNIGSGIEHGFDIFEENGQQKFVPLIRCNRYETIDRAVTGLLTPAENIVEVIDGKIRETPTQLLPAAKSNKVLEDLEAHLITGSEREKMPDGSTGEYVDKCANHFLLAMSYAVLAEGQGVGSKVTPPRPPKAFQRGGIRSRDRRNREVSA